MSEIRYNRQNNRIQCVAYSDCEKEYPLHTHTNHIMLGTVNSGNIVVCVNGVETEYSSGQEFSILPNIPHSIRPGDRGKYSMVVMCVKTDVDVNDENLAILWERIISEPENAGMIEEMAEQIHLSPYHMIRQFKKAFGLTPHQFQIQSKVRKAQRMIEEGNTIQETSLATGFFDESHMIRCFQKYIRMTPVQYRESLINKK